MEQDRIFSILDSVDSTNNYAMARVHEGLAKHGMAWFATHQKSGKGQRGKSWISNPGENIILSIAVVPPGFTERHKFAFNAVIANVCIDFFKSLTTEEFFIKWPNDIYWRDRKAGGILIENLMNGNQWKWSVIGIGINVNQTRFYNLVNPVSIKSITGREYDTIALAKQLHIQILDELDKLTEADVETVMDKYNSSLFKKNEEVHLRKDNVVFKTQIQRVDQFGNLLTKDALDRTFTFGEVEWVW